MKTIEITQIIGTKRAMFDEEGAILYHAIKSELENNTEDIVLDVSKVEKLTTAFLNYAVGQLVFENGSLIDRVSLTGADGFKEEQFQRAISNAKNFRAHKSLVEEAKEFV